MVRPNYGQIGSLVPQSVPWAAMIKAPAFAPGFGLTRTGFTAQQNLNSAHSGTQRSHPPESLFLWLKSNSGWGQGRVRGVVPCSQTGEGRTQRCINYTIQVTR